MLAHAFVLTLILMNCAVLRAGSSSTPLDTLEHAALSEKLGRLFSQEKIATILSKLPAKSKIFGYDIGDFSGNDALDVVLSTRNAGSRSRVLDVLFFVNDGPRFDLVHSLRRSFVYDPIEVGITIERGICHITEKTGEFDWRITGYSVIAGVFRRVSEWTSSRVRSGQTSTSVGIEASLDYTSNLTREHYYGVNTGRSFLNHAYYTLPVYPADLEVSPDIRTSIGDTSGLMIVRGGSSWYGPEDCSFTVSASYDSAWVTFRAAIRDDNLLAHHDVDSCDYFAFHFDFSGLERVTQLGEIQDIPEHTLGSVLILMGDGDSRGPVALTRGAVFVDSLRDRMQLTVTTNAAQPDVWMFTLMLPLTAFISDGELRAVGFAAVYHDVDHDTRRDWVTISSSARAYAEGRPERYGRLRFISDPIAWNERVDLRTRILASQLRGAGILRSSE